MAKLHNTLADRTQQCAALRADCERLRKFTSTSAVLLRAIFRIDQAPACIHNVHSLFGPISEQQIGLW